MNQPPRLYRFTHPFLHPRVEEWRDSPCSGTNTSAMLVTDNYQQNEDGEETYHVRGFTFDDDVYYDMTSIY